MKNIQDTAYIDSNGEINVLDASQLLHNEQNKSQDQVQFERQQKYKEKQERAQYRNVNASTSLGELPPYIQHRRNTFIQAFNKLKQQKYSPKYSTMCKNLDTFAIDIDVAQILSQVVSNTCVGDAKISQIIELCLEQLHVFAFNDYQVGNVTCMEHAIPLVPNAQPKAQTPYRLSNLEKRFVEKEIPMWEKLGYIVKCMSPWASPIVIVPKHNGKLRLCVDFRYLNNLSIAYNWPLPNIDELLALLCNMYICSKLDARYGFLNMFIKEDDRLLTSFVCHLGQFMFIRMPFGLRNAPASFQRAIEYILSSVINQFVLVYIDDIIVFSSSVDQHIKHLREVFRLLIQGGIKLHPEKCQLFVNDIVFLGHRIYKGHVYPEQSKIDVIAKLAIPTSKTQLKSFIGLASYYRKFISNFSSIIAPLTALTANVNYEWTDTCTRAFETIKSSILKIPSLRLPMPDRQFTLATDFSTFGLGACLSQINEDGIEVPVEFASRSLNQHEKRYGSYEGEVLSVVWALTKFRYYLAGQKFILYTDNQALSYVLNKPTLSPKIERWILKLSSFNFEVRHRKGINNQVADALSRLPQNKVNIMSTASVVSNIIPLQFSNIEPVSLHLIFDVRTLQPYDTLCKLNVKSKYQGEVQPLQVYQPLDLVGDIPCKVCCKLSNPDQLLLCEDCGNLQHTYCHNPSIENIPDTAYYCPDCMLRLSFIPFGSRDITQDFSLLDYLCTREFPSDMQDFEKDRIISRSQNFIYNGKVLMFHPPSLNSKLVPTLFARRQLLTEYHDNNNHIGITKTMLFLSRNYYWHNMQKDTIAHIKNCVVCLANKPNFIEPASLLPLDKGSKPFQYWSLDLATNLPTTSHGNKHLLIIVDPFSKWLELLPIRSKESLEIAIQFYKNIICRYGLPHTIRTDGGTEFMGYFDTLLYNLNIAHTQTTPNNPRSNGQSKRFVQTVIQMLKKCIAHRGSELTSWDQLLPHVLYTLRFCPSTVFALSPFRVTHGYEPNLINPTSMQPPAIPFPEPSLKQVNAFQKQLTQLQSDMFKKLDTKLKVTDTKRTGDYSFKHQQQKAYKFMPQQLVFKNKGPRRTKLQLPSDGPYIFNKHLTKGNCEIIDPHSGKKYVINTSNLQPIPQLKSQQEEDIELDTDQSTQLLCEWLALSLF